MHQDSAATQTRTVAFAGVLRFRYINPQLDLVFPQLILAEKTTLLAVLHTGIFGATSSVDMTTDD